MLKLSLLKSFTFACISIGAFAMASPCQAASADAETSVVVVTVEDEINGGFFYKDHATASFSASWTSTGLMAQSDWGYHKIVWSESLYSDAFFSSFTVIPPPHERKHVTVQHHYLAHVWVYHTDDENQFEAEDIANAPCGA